MSGWQVRVWVFGGAVLAISALLAFMVSVNEFDPEVKKRGGSPIRLDVLSFQTPEPPAEPEEIPEEVPEDPPEPEVEDMAMRDEMAPPPMLPEIREIIGSTVDLASDVRLLDGLRASPLPVGKNLAQGIERPKREKISIYEEWQVTQTSRPLHSPKPVYPRRAQRRAIEGHVAFLFVVNVNGKAEQIRIADAKPRGVFEEAAKDALLSTRFEPALLEGRRVPCRAKRTYYFQLDG